ncbi:MAG: O-6-alkylguanine-DNA--cysteine-protein methyltransferase [Anaerolineales bacterium]
MHFTSPPNPQVYYAQVWNLVRQVQRGQVATYGQIALLLPPPPGVDFETYRAFGPRWVGGALAACPEDVPWQRVVNAKGAISPRPGADKQRELLEQEGVTFNEKGCIDLKKFGWGISNPQQPTLW